MSDPKFTGIWIPAIVLTYPISITAKVCYGVVDGLDNEDGCFASNAYLQTHLQLEKRQLQNILKELDDAKLIVRQEVAGRRIIRTVAKMALVKACTEGCNKLHPYSKEDKKEDKNTVQEMEWILRLPFGSEAFINAWKSWVAYRKQLKRKLTDASVQAQFKDFALWGEAKSIDAIERSIRQGWQGLFEPTGNVAKGNTKPLTAKDHESF
ncbi:MAG: hypothetical protein EBS38_07770 [Actinobacteria bacterium]|nr:hypothetical protein [Actinomycetota bacterium]